MIGRRRSIHCQSGDRFGWKSEWSVIDAIHEEEKRKKTTRKVQEKDQISDQGPRMGAGLADLDFGIEKRIVGGTGRQIGGGPGSLGGLRPEESYCEPLAGATKPS